MTFETAVAFTLDQEGGISNDPLDPGKLTKFGISSKVYPEVLNSQFSRTDAIAIYRRDFWDRLKCDNLTWPVALLLFDTAVDHGQATAVRWLQQALQLKADGIIGDQTTKAAWAATPEQLVDVLASRSLEYARDLGLIHFGRGWMRRLFHLHSEILKGTT